MEVSQKKKFEPITITLENEKEAAQFFRIIDTVLQARDQIGWSKEAQAMLIELSDIRSHELNINNV